MKPDILFYCGLSETMWNYSPVEPGDYACISPVKGRSQRTHTENRVYVPPGTKVLQDSGAFQDTVINRLSMPTALERQQKHAEKYHYADLIECRATYDWLIDETALDGVRYKRRWTEAAAEAAVQETIAAAEFYSQNRDGVPLVISAQGVTPSQYLDCVERLMPYFQAGDLLGLGGWCVVGKWPKQIYPVFQETMRRVIPFAAKEGIQRIHIFGVIHPASLGYLLSWCQEYGLILSTDSTWPSLKPCFGDWGYGAWRDNQYQRPPVEIIGLERIRHVRLTRDWLANFRKTEHYLFPKVTPIQLALPM